MRKVTRFSLQRGKALAAAGVSLAALALGGGAAAAQSTEPAATTNATPPAAKTNATPPAAKTNATPPAAKTNATPPAAKTNATPPAGTQSLGSYTRVTGPTSTLPAGAIRSEIATCPAGQVVLGGGESNTAPGTVVLTDSFPSNTATWQVYVKNNDSVSRTFTVYAVCGS